MPVLPTYAWRLSPLTIRARRDRAGGAPVGLDAEQGQVVHPVGAARGGELPRAALGDPRARAPQDGGGAPVAVSGREPERLGAHPGEEGGDQPEGQQAEQARRRAARVAGAAPGPPGGAGGPPGVVQRRQACRRALLVSPPERRSLEQGGGALLAYPVL
nr:hypothetical protein GCM10020092_010270 [Actinoplanes digitatis]